MNVVDGIMSILLIKKNYSKTQNSVKFYAN